MPRGVRKILDFNEELKKIDGQIDELKAKRSALLEKKRVGESKLLPVYYCYFKLLRT